MKYIYIYKIIYIYNVWGKLSVCQLWCASEIWDLRFYQDSSQKRIWDLRSEILPGLISEAHLRSEIWDSTRPHLRCWIRFWDESWWNLRSQISEALLRWVLVESQISDAPLRWILTGSQISDFGCTSEVRPGRNTHIHLRSTSDLPPARTWKHRCTSARLNISDVCLSWALAENAFVESVLLSCGWDLQFSLKTLILAGRSQNNMQKKKFCLRDSKQLKKLKFQESLGGMPARQDFSWNLAFLVFWDLTSKIWFCFFAEKWDLSSKIYSFH